MCPKCKRCAKASCGKPIEGGLDGAADASVVDSVRCSRCDKAYHTGCMPGNSAQEKRDGHLSKEQRLERMQQVIGHCGADNKQCMREMLGQAEGATDEDAVRF